MVSRPSAHEPSSIVRQDSIFFELWSCGILVNHGSHSECDLDGESKQSARYRNTELRRQKKVFFSFRFVNPCVVR